MWWSCRSLPKPHSIPPRRLSIGNSSLLLELDFFSKSGGLPLSPLPWCPLSSFVARKPFLWSSYAYNYLKHFYVCTIQRSTVIELPLLTTQSLCSNSPNIVQTLLLLELCHTEHLIGSLFVCTVLSMKAVIMYCSYVYTQCSFRVVELFYFINSEHGW